jgi:hypothetical protein
MKEREELIIKPFLFNGWSRGKPLSSRVRCCFSTPTLREKRRLGNICSFSPAKRGMRIMASAGGTPSRLSVLSDPTMEPKEYYEMMVASLKIARGDPGTGEPEASLGQAVKTLRTLAQQ